MSNKENTNIENDRLKYNQAYLESTPSETYPTMYTIVKTVKKLNELEGRRFLTLSHAKAAVDTLRGESLIKRGEKVATIALQDNGLKATE